MQRHLAIVELREQALVAREKASRARRVALRSVGGAGDAFKREASEFDAKADRLENQIEALRAQL